MAKRKIIKIDEQKCNGCGQCIPNCPEGALQVIDGKARLISDLFCDGLGACIGHCPEGAISIEERQAQEYNEKKVMEFAKKTTPAQKGEPAHLESELRQWPVQIKLVPVNAPYFKDADLLIAADCVPFAYADFHQDLLKAKILLVGCPKLNDAEFYKEKITQILKQNNIRSITCVHMEVPCCFGLVSIVKEALGLSGKKIPVKGLTVGIQGELK